jgi:hypothetical protein
MGTDRGRQAMAAIGLLADELRQRLYRFVRAQPTVTQDQAAAAAGISRKLAAFHLDKLVARLLAGAGRAVGPRRWAVVCVRAASLCRCPGPRRSLVMRPISGSLRTTLRPRDQCRSSVHRYAAAWFEFGRIMTNREDAGDPGPRPAPGHDLRLEY